MLFEEIKKEQKKTERPALPADAATNYEIGFLFNFAAGKSSRFDLEPLLLFKKNKAVEYKRISLQVERGLAYLSPLDDSLYTDYLEFSDRKLLQWMDHTGNRYIRNANNGSWAHASVRELINLRKHYIELLQKLWPVLHTWPNIFIHKNGKFNHYAPNPVKLGTQPVKVSFKVETKGQSIVIKMILSLDGNETAMNLTGGFLLEKDNTLYLPPNPGVLNFFDSFKNGPLTFPLSIKKEVIHKHVLPLLGKYEVTLSKELNVELISPDIQPRIQLSELNDSNLMIRPLFFYDEAEVDYGEEENHVAEAEEKLTIIRRDKPAEKALYEYLRTLHPSFKNQRNNLYYYLHFDDVMKRGWLIKMLQQVQDQGYAIHGLSALKKFRYSPHTPHFTVSASSKIDWFDLKITVHWGEQQVPLKEIRQAILNGQDMIMLNDGTLGHIPEEWISQYTLLLRTGTEDNGTLRVSKIHFTLLDHILDKFDSQSQKEIELRKQKLLHYDEVPKVSLSKKIKATLRPYQHSGFHWMQALDELGWGGCLADDMGLGKTLQTISFLQFLKEKYPGSTQLVVCPTSLIFNWENELQKFSSHLKYYIYYGTQREFTETHFEEYDVIITSYGVVRNDQEVLTNFLWQYIILDESQAIKNPDAHVTKAAKQLKAVNRLILSGTPVQNNTSDLFAQFDFLNPGFLGTREFFKREFSEPIDKMGDKKKTEQLRKLIYPFILRRTKEQVAKDLPDKTVTVLWCSMEGAQRKLYNHYRDGYRNKLLNKIDKEGIGKSGMDVLEGLLRLRQICDHPSLVDKGKDAEMNSVKIQELLREVQENAGNHKLLVFSQFTGMLQLIREEFVTAGVPYCYLDGSTSLPQRKEQVERFQEDENVKAFLISLKAGGVGLNLTVADYVYIVDPWWNPAAEHQAIDRAHRIGQTRKVFAYKMICKDSVEEKILQLQERKKRLADDLIQEDTSFVKSLTREDVAFLFG